MRCELRRKGSPGVGVGKVEADFDAAEVAAC